MRICGNSSIERKENRRYAYQLNIVLIKSIILKPEYRGRGLGGFPEGVGGVADHVHLLISLKATHCLADVMRELKKRSSAWVHQEIGLSAFVWQEGYGAFSISATSRQAVREYIANQDAHHRIIPYREELVTMLNKAKLMMPAEL